jgi:hypothetical protein
MSNEAALSYAVRLIEGKATVSEPGCLTLANAVIRLTRLAQPVISGNQINGDTVAFGTARGEDDLPPACPHCKSSSVEVRNWMPGYFKSDYRCENEWHRQQLRVMAQVADSQEVELLRAEIVRLNTLLSSHQLGTARRGGEPTE